MGWLLLLLFIILVLIVWYALTRNAKKYQQDLHLEEYNLEPQEEITEIPTRAGRAAAAIQMEQVKEVGIPDHDDLTIVEGIGPKVSSVLNHAGIFTLRALSETDAAYLKEILINANYPYMDPGTWPEQARLAADGKIEELKSYQDELKAGRN